MKRVVLKLSLLLLLLTLAGCSEDKSFETGELTSLEIPVSETEKLVVPFPSTLTLTETDNNVYWEYEQGVNIYVMTSTSKGFAKQTVYSDVYSTKTSVMKILDTCSIVLECPDYMSITFISLLGKSYLEDSNLVLKEDYRLESLPTYNNVEMLLDKHNFYMPLNVTDNVRTLYVSAIVNNGKDWLECWTKDCDEIVLELQLLNLVSCNSNSDIVTWYEDADILYTECGDNICAAKRLSFNQWYIYSGSAFYKDYILQGLDLIHRSE